MAKRVGVWASVSWLHRLPSSCDGRRKRLDQASRISRMFVVFRSVADAAHYPHCLCFNLLSVSLLTGSVMPWVLVRPSIDSLVSPAHRKTNKMAVAFIGSVFWENLRIIKQTENRGFLLRYLDWTQTCDSPASAPA